MSTPGSAELFARGYGLVIGVGEYTDPSWRVPVAARDAAAAHAALTDPAAAAYPPAQVDLITDGAATRQGIGLALRRLAERSGPEHTVFLSFTGHGALGDDGLYYLATSDTLFSSGEHIRQNTGFNIAELAHALQAIKAERLLVVINACFAGHLGALATVGGLRPDPDGPSVGMVLPNDEADRLLASGGGRALITASRTSQRSYFRADDTHSYFGQALVDALRGAGIAGSGGLIGLFELYTAIYNQVRRVTSGLGREQEPALSLVDGAGAFGVARRAGGPLLPGDERHISQSVPTGAVRLVPATTVQALGHGSSAINAGAGASVRVNSTTGLINFGAGAQAGDITFRGDAALGDIVKIGSGAQKPDADDPPEKSPLEQLPRLAVRLASARNVDEDARDDAAQKIRQADRALAAGDRARARTRLEEALSLMRAMGNGFVDSLARRVRAALDEL